MRNQKRRASNSSDSGEETSSPPLNSSLLSQLDNSEFSDVTLNVSGKEIHCHKSILVARSHFFETMFNSSYKESGTTSITLEDVQIDLFENLLEFMYSDSIQINLKTVFDVLSLADRFGMNSFKMKCDILLSQHININTVCLIFKYSNEFNLNRLKETCLCYMEENYDGVIYSSGFEELDKDEMLRIIRLCKDKGKKLPI